jgi:2-oxo-3-hexenedioate decarboxylase
VFVKDKPLGPRVTEIGRAFGRLFYEGTLDTSIDDIASFSIEDAYLMQDAAIAFRESRGEDVAGYKVGCMSSAIRQQFGLENPVHGRLPRQHIRVGSNHTVDLSHLVGCAIEPELVIRLGRNLDPSRLSDDNLMASISSLSPGIELHNYQFWHQTPTAQELIASNCLFAGLLVGKSHVSPKQFHFEDALFSVHIDDAPVTSGRASEIIGGLLESLRWLVTALAERGQEVIAGDWVIPGSPVELVRVQSGTNLTVNIDGAGTLSASFHHPDRMNEVETCYESR